MYKNFCMDTNGYHNLLASLELAWSNLSEQTAQVSQAIRSDTEFPAWVYRENAGDESRDAAANAVSQLWFTDGQNPKTTIKCPGVLGASLATLRHVEKLNARKKQFRRVLLTIDKHCADGARDELIHDILSSIGLARLHRVQAYRQLHVVTPAPEKIAFFWARVRRVQRVTAAALLQEIDLERLPVAKRPAAFQDKARLKSIPGDEILAKVDHLPAHSRANIWWRPDCAADKRRQMTVTLPLLYPSKPNAPLIRLKYLKDPSQSKRRVRRADQKLESTPCLITAPVYRYKERYRHRDDKRHD